MQSWYILSLTGRTNLGVTELDRGVHENKKGLLTGLFMALIMTTMPIGGMVSADEGATANDGHGPIYKRDILFDSELITKALTG